MNLKTNSSGWLSTVAVIALLSAILIDHASAQRPTAMVFRRRAPNVVVFKIGHLATGTGPVIDGVMMRIKAGMIAEIGKKIAIPKGARVVDLGDSWVFPGMIDLQSKASMPHDLEEPRDAVDLDNRPSRAVVRDHRDFKLLAQAGITAVVITPSAEGVVSGVCAVVKSSSPARIAFGSGPVALALTASTQKRSRFPTSLMGAFQLLGQTLAKPSNKVLAAVAANQRASLIKVDTEAEIRAYLRLANALGLEGAMVTDGSVRRVMNDLVRPMSIALPAIGLNSPRRDLLLPAALDKSKHKVAFYSLTPDRSATDLRYAAALAVKMGLKRSAGLHSITKHPAEMAGMGKHIGTLAKGKDADFLVLSGHLLDLDAVLKQTWIDGHLVYQRSEKKAEVSR